MKIEYVKGDLFNTDIKTIVHGCNSQGVMGSGVAKIIREKYPMAYEQYRNEYDLHKRLQMGKLIVVPCGDIINDPCNFKIIVNAITQEFFGRDDKRYVSYDAIDNVMCEINNFPKTFKVNEIAMPQIGAGLGNGSWEVISAIIENRLTNVKPYVYIKEE